jgi:hemoglobin-like flavoprotein
VRPVAPIEVSLPRQRHDVDASGGPPPVSARETGLGWAVPPRPARRDVAAIQASLSAVRERPVALAETFYRHLFEIAPAARAMFAADMTVQMQRMTDVLLAALAALRSDAEAGSATVDDTGADAGADDEAVGYPALERSLHALGVAHRDRWNVLAEHYRLIPHALVRAVRDVAGPVWSGSLSSSWIALSQWIIGHMLLGHHDAVPPG